MAYVGSHRRKHTSTIATGGFIATVNIASLATREAHHAACQYAMAVWLPHGDGWRLAKMSRYVTRWLVSAMGPPAFVVITFNGYWL